MMHSLLHAVTISCKADEWRKFPVTSKVSGVAVTTSYIRFTTTTAAVCSTGRLHREGGVTDSSVEKREKEKQ